MGSGFAQGVESLPCPFLTAFRVPGPIERGAWLLRCLFGVGGKRSGGGAAAGGLRPPARCRALPGRGLVFRAGAKGPGPKNAAAPPHVRLSRPASHERPPYGWRRRAGEGEEGDVGSRRGAAAFCGPRGPAKPKHGRGKRSPPMLCARCARPPPPRAAGIFHRPNDPSANPFRFGFLQTKRARRSR